PLLGAPPARVALLIVERVEPAIGLEDGARQPRVTGPRGADLVRRPREERRAHERLRVGAARLEPLPARLEPSDQVPPLRGARRAAGEGAQSFFARSSSCAPTSARSVTRSLESALSLPAIASRSGRSACGSRESAGSKGTRSVFLSSSAGPVTALASVFATSS